MIIDITRIFRIIIFLYITPYRSLQHLNTLLREFWVVFDEASERFQNVLSFINLGFVSMLFFIIDYFHDEGFVVFEAAAAIFCGHCEMFLEPFFQAVLKGFLDVLDYLFYVLFDHGFLLANNLPFLFSSIHLF